MATKKPTKQKSRAVAKKKVAAVAKKKSTTAEPKVRKSKSKSAEAAKKSPRKSAAKAVAKAAGQSRSSVPENPRAQALARSIAALVLDKKALDVVVLDVRGMTSYADYFVIASGESDRQVSAMAEHVHTELKKKDGLSPVGHEGMETGRWVLLDYGEVVAHLFFNEVRAFYDLEGLWADAAREKVA